MPLQKSYKLNSGFEIPAVGLGTWLSKPNEVREAVKTALQSGYVHVDAAAIYQNEGEVGQGIKESGVNRADIFVTSKLWNTHHAPHDVEPALDKTLADLQLDYLDLYLIHWPVSFTNPDTGKTAGNPWFPTDPSTHKMALADPQVPLLDTWRALEALVAKGKVRSIGLSNCTVPRLQEVLAGCKIKPAVNQVELHAYFQQQELVKWCQEHDILVEAYSPLGNNIYGLPRCVDDPAVEDVAKQVGKSPAQVLISWLLMRGVVVLPKSVTPARIKENAQVFELPKEAFEKINSLDRNHRYNVPARWGYDVFDELSHEQLQKAVDDFVTSQKK